MKLRPVLTWLLIMLALTGPVAAGPVADFSGVWMMETWAADPWPLEPPFNEAGRRAQQQWVAAPESDPAHRCLIHLVRIASGPFPHEIIQQPDRILILYEYQHEVRRVYLDGRAHPGDTFPTLMGHSNGKIDGNTLVIDTTGVEAGYLRPQGFPHSEGLHVIERHTLLGSNNRKQIEWTISDGAYYTQPWTVKTTWKKTNTEISDYYCEVEPHLQPE